MFVDENLSWSAVSINKYSLKLSKIFKDTGYWLRNYYKYDSTAKTPKIL
jgi:hypothetical protein